MEYKNKCRALFLIDIWLYYGKAIYVDECLEKIPQFINDCYLQNEDLLDLIMDTGINEDNEPWILLFNSDEEFVEVFSYANRLSKNGKKLIELLNELGDEVVNDIAKITELNCSYLNNMEEDIEDSRVDSIRFAYSKMKH